MLAEVIATYSMTVGFIATVSLLLLVFLAVVFERRRVNYKKSILFIIILLTTILPTLFFIGSTLYLNFISSSRGPVHWHADIEVWVCGKELDFLNPKGLSNKVGTPILHEHNDKRIHLEGVVVEKSDASLGNFFSVIGGVLTNQVLSVPTNSGVKTLINGSSCPDGSNGNLQAFVYSTVNGVYSQKKLTDIGGYIISPYSQVPQGDCIIIEFAENKERTEKLCRSYKVAEEIGKVSKSQENGIKKGNIYGN